MYKRGFTLIELLIVIAVIGVLAAGLVITINPGAQLAKARDTQRKADLKNIQTALELYHQDNGKYPTWPAAGTIIDYSYANPTNFIPGFTSYMTPLPKDPIQSTPSQCSGGFFEPPTCYSYAYEAVNSGKEYRLYTHLENKDDPETCNKKTIPGSWFDGWAGLNAGCPEQAGTQYGNNMTVFSPGFTR